MFHPIQMTMIALSSFIVEADDSHATHGVNGSVLVRVRTGRKRSWQSPHDHFKNRSVGVNVFKSRNQCCRHVGKNANVRRDCQRSGQMLIYLSCTQGLAVMRCLTASWMCRSWLCRGESAPCEKLVTMADYGKLWHRSLTWPSMCLYPKNLKIACANT